MPRYSREFYAEESNAARKAARVILPSIIELVRPVSIVDVGCGTGRWLRRYRDVGFSPIGVDATIGMLRIARVH